MRDGQTGARSRRAFEEDLPELLERARRDERPLALFLLDVDHLKTVNDAFGHQRGDALLAAVVRRAGSTVRETDRLYRYGGDEFVLLLPDTPRETALATMERLATVVAARPVAGTPPLRCAISAGGALFPEDATEAAALLARADVRLLMAKRGGRARVLAVDELEAPVGGTAAGRMLDRDAELARARSFLDELRVHERGALILRGPAGSGRTRLAAEIASLGRVRDLTVVELRPGRAARSREHAALDPLDGPHPLPGLATETPPGVAAARVLHAAATGTAALVVVVDAVEHLDVGTARTLAAALASSTRTPIGLVLTATEASPARALAADLPLVEEVPLRPLGAPALRAWLLAALRREPDDATIAWFLQRTGGLPARVEATVAALARDGLVRPAPDGGLELTETALGAADPAGERPAEPAAGAPPTLVGRGREAHAVAAALAAQRLVTIVGQGGSGKTTLALQVARELAGRYADGVHVVRLGAVGESWLLLDAVRDALGLAVEPGTPALEAIEARFGGGQPALLVLDELEHLVDGAGALADVLAAAPGLRLLVTSRVALRLPGETLVALGGVPVDSAPGDELQPALRLLVQAAGRRRPGYLPAAEDVDDLRAVCRDVQGLPLLLELAAAWLPVLGAAGLAEALRQDPAAVLDADGATGARGPVAALDAVTAELGPAERDVLARLSVFPGAFGREAAATVAGASTFLLGALVDRALVERLGDGRHAMHPLVRQHAASGLRDAEAVRRRHAAWVEALVLRADRDLRGAGDAAALRALDDAYADVRAVLERALRAGDAAAALRVVGGLGVFAASRGHVGELRHWADLALARRDGVAPRTVARALAAVGVALGTWRDPEAQPYLDEAEALGAACGDAFARGVAAPYRVLAALDAGDPEGAEAIGRVWLPRLRRRRDQFDAAELHNALGIVATEQGRPADAEPLFAAAGDIFRALGNRAGIAQSLNNLGSSVLSRGEPAAARPLVLEALTAWRELAHRAGVSVALVNLGEIDLEVGDVAAAEARLAESERLAREVAFVPVAEHSRLLRARAALLRGAAATAIERARDVVVAAEHRGDERTASTAREIQAEAEAALAG